MAEYKQISVTPQTAAKIDELKTRYAEKGTPMQAPTIVGLAINKLSKDLK
jgi:hypothetical protein